MTKTKDFLATLHDKLESLHDDLDGFAGALGCDDQKDVSFGGCCTIEALEEAGLTKEDAEFFANYIEEGDFACLRYAAHSLYWDAQD